MYDARYVDLSSKLNEIPAPLSQRCVAAVIKATSNPKQFFFLFILPLVKNLDLKQADSTLVKRQ